MRMPIPGARSALPTAFFAGLFACIVCLVSASRAYFGATILKNWVHVPSAGRGLMAPDFTPVDDRFSSETKILEGVKFHALDPGPKPLLNDDPGVCKLHQLKMTRQLVPVTYGYVNSLRSYLETTQNTFPNSDDPVMGGCFVGGPAQMEMEKDVCDQCNEGRNAWWKEHASSETSKRR